MFFSCDCALEAQPDAPAEQVGTEKEIGLIRSFVKHKTRAFTVRDFVRGVAKLGGFLGRKRDGEPGVRALWRGYQRLQDMLFGLQLHASQDSMRKPRLLVIDSRQRRAYTAARKAPLTGLRNQDVTQVRAPHRSGSKLSVRGHQPLAASSASASSS